MHSTLNQSLLKNIQNNLNIEIQFIKDLTILIFFTLLGFKTKKVYLHNLDSTIYNLVLGDGLFLSDFLLMT